MSPMRLTRRAFLRTAAAGALVSGSPMAAATRSRGAQTTLNIPLGWTVLEAPARGFGNRGGKHQAWAKNSINGRWYTCGGDYPGDAAFEASYRQEVHSLDLAARLAGDRNAGWAVEQPYCRSDGGMQPKHPDTIGWQWWSKGRKFVMIPGGMATQGKSNCAGETALPQSDGGRYIWRDGAMAFDPITKTWEHWSGGNGELDGTDNRFRHWHSIYDPDRDRFIRFDEHEANGMQAQALTPGVAPTRTAAWSIIATNLRNASGGRAMFATEHLALDRQRRRIYGVDINGGRLVYFSLATNTLSDVGQLPAFNRAITTNVLVYDELHDALLYQPYGLGFWAFSIALGKWSALDRTTPIGPARGRMGFFDNEANVFVLYGVNDDDAGSYSEFVYFFYRYKTA